ncbi:YbaN family protein [Cetobacterium sp.]|uniref:YbaN family protein n=1 Tax=Cetobacterium sp. TaxID=2071632 RepID=UPI0025D944F2|nr:YbaN family protein [uncultured Cetobacterium sp.]
MKKKLFFILGCLSLLLGAIGIFLPILPTTPFVLLSAFLFERSSEKFHKLLLENKIFGKYIKDYTEKKGITYKNKIIAITVMTLGMGKGFLAMTNIYGRVALVITFFAVLTHLIKMKTLKEG